MSSKPPLAEIKLRGRSDKPTLDATVAADVAKEMGASAGDLLVVERGTAWAAERAATQGRYFIVTVKRGTAQSVAPDAPEPGPTEIFKETLDETIGRLRRERQR